MRQVIWSALVVAAGLGLAGGCCMAGGGQKSGGATAAADGAKPACAMCAKGVAGENEWCETCKQGYVGGQKVTCAGCYAAKTGGPACPTCSAKSNW